MTPKIHCKYDKLVPPDELTPHPKNPNQHPEDQMRRLIEYIKFTGWRHGVIVSNQTGLVIVGHARRMAAIAIGCECPVVYQDFEDEAEELAFLNADNRLPELSIVDDVLLSENLNLLAEDGFNMEMIGFDDDIDLSFDESPSVESGGTNCLDEFKVFVSNNLRKDFVKLLREFSEENGESAVQWQRR